MDSKEVAPKQFDNDSDNEDEKKMVAVTMDEFDALQKIPNSGKATEKTRYDKLTTLSIEKVSVVKLDGIQKSNDGDRYVDYRVNLHYSNGEKEGHGGFRAYLDEAGKPNRFWSSEKSAGGKLKKTLEIFLELSEPMTFHQFVSNLQGLSVRVRSEDWNVKGDKGFKNIVFEIIGKAAPQVE